MSGPSAAKSSVQFFPILWEKENFTSSIHGQDEDGDGSDYTRNSKSRLSASADRRGIFNRYAHIAGMSKFKADFRFAPFPPSPGTSRNPAPPPTPSTWSSR